MQRISLAISLDTRDARAAVQTVAQNHGFEIVVDEAPDMEPHVFLERLSRLRPQIVFIETTRMWGPLERVVESLCSGEGAPAVVVVHSHPDPDIIMEAMRAGAAGLIYPPFELNAQKCVEQCLRGRDGIRRSDAGKTLGFLSVKGGCGATTIACHVAAEVQRSCGKSVLLADFDPDLGIVSFLLKTKSQYSMVDALQHAERLDRSMWQAFAASGSSGVSVLGAPEEAGEAGLGPRRSSLFFRFVRSEYDVTVVDLGRGVTRFNITAMTDLDFVYLVTTMEIPALHRARRTIRTLLNGGCTSERLRLIVNFTQKRQDVTISELEKMIEFPVFATVPEDIAAIVDAYSQQGLVSPGTTLGKQISAIASRLTGQPEREPRKFRLFARG